MRPDVVLLADAGPGIGWGHAIRQLALAEALVARGAKVLFATRTFDALRLDWPCPVGLTDDMSEQQWLGSHVISDLPSPSDAPEVSMLAFDDYGREDEYIIDPHFGAVERRDAPWYSFLGPRWAPLRKEFRDGRPHLGRSGVFVYPGSMPDLPKGVTERRLTSTKAADVAATMERAVVAYVTPSMVALECLAVGTPVVLHVPEPKYQPIADAMVAAGVAEIWDGTPEDYTLARVLADDGLRARMSEAGMDHVDGKGAERLAEWLT